MYMPTVIDGKRVGLTVNRGIPTACMPLLPSESTGLAFMSSLSRARPSQTAAFGLELSESRSETQILADSGDCVVLVWTPDAGALGVTVTVTHTTSGGRCDALMLNTRAAAGETSVDGVADTSLGTACPCCASAMPNTSDSAQPGSKEADDEFAAGGVHVSIHFMTGAAGWLATLAAKAGSLSPKGGGKDSALGVADAGECWLRNAAWTFCETDVVLVSGEAVAVISEGGCAAHMAELRQPPDSPSRIGGEERPSIAAKEVP